MNSLHPVSERRRRTQSGQDLIEYALMAGSVALSAGVIVPGVADSIKTIWLKMVAVMNHTTFAAFAQEANDSVTIRMVCAVLAVMIIGLIVLRRKKEIE